MLKEGVGGGVEGAGVGVGIWMGAMEGAEEQRGSQGEKREATLPREDGAGGGSADRVWWRGGEGGGGKAGGIEEVLISISIMCATGWARVE